MCFENVKDIQQRSLAFRCFNDVSRWGESSQHRPLLDRSGNVQFSDFEKRLQNGLETGVEIDVLLVLYMLYVYIYIYTYKTKIRFKSIL